jgi:hypothetical protein
MDSIFFKGTLQSTDNINIFLKFLTKMGSINSFASASSLAIFSAFSVKVTKGGVLLLPPTTRKIEGNLGIHNSASLLALS